MTGRPLPDGFALRLYTVADRDWVAAAHAAHYRVVERFGPDFDATVASALDDITAGLGRDRTFGLILTGADGAGRGSVFVHDMGGAARLRLFLIEARLQGRGLGRAMLCAALASAGTAGFRRVVVSTFDAHAAACRLYALAGFAEQGRTPCTAFGRRMVRVDFGLDLRVR